MDPVTHALVQFGGIGVLAAAILLLHRESLKSFREELSKDRLAHTNEMAKLIDTDSTQRELTRAAFTQALDRQVQMLLVQKERHEENVIRLNQILEHVRREPRTPPSS